MSNRLSLTFAKVHGGKYLVRLRVRDDLLVSASNPRAIASLITRAVATARRRGIQLGVCLRIARGEHVVFNYVTDTAWRFR